MKGGVNVGEQRNDAEFPVEMYIVTRDQIFPAGRSFRELHWHEELQIDLVVEGRAELQVNGQSYRLNAGEAVFINRNVLHITTDLSENGRYVSFHFSEQMLGFFKGSRMEQEDVLPFTGPNALSAVLFKKEIPWQAVILENLQELKRLFMDEIWREKGEHTEYRVSLLLAGLWYQLICHMEGKLPVPSRCEVHRRERIRKMLSYIHTNYKEPIRLREIAESADVSEGECCRCFRKMIGQSPNQYLNGYRLLRAAELLTETEYSIADIARETGFSDTSHFIQYFRRKNGITPKEYRERIIKK